MQQVTDGDGGRKTDRELWDDAWKPVRSTMPSSLNVAVADVQRILSQHILPGMKFMELGCAPGKILLWVEKRLGAQCWGVDYSANGVAITRKLLVDCGSRATVIEDDVFTTSTADGTFDVVYSNGLIEHFSDIGPIIQRHLDFLKPGGVAVMLIPNYGGIYGSVQGRLDPENLAIHNLSIMTPSALKASAAGLLASNVSTSYVGRPSLWLLTLARLGPSRITYVLQHIVSVTMRMLPLHRWGRLSPMIMMIIKK